MHASSKINIGWTKGCLFHIIGRHVHFLGWTSPRAPPPPKPPFQCPHPDRKGTNLLLFGFCIHLHTHQDLKLKCCRALKQKLRYRRPCTWPTRHPQLTCLASRCFEFPEFQQWLSHTGTILEVWSEMLLHWLDSHCGQHPSACASYFWTCLQTPPFTYFLKKSGNRLGIS
jgi:hypothetical protein